MPARRPDTRGTDSASPHVATCELGEHEEDAFVRRRALDT